MTLDDMRRAAVARSLFTPTTLQHALDALGLCTPIRSGPRRARRTSRCALAWPATALVISSVDIPASTCTRTVDQPLALANLTRLEVPGSPDVGWVRVTVTPTARNPFTFEKRVIRDGSTGKHRLALEQSLG